MNKTFFKKVFLFLGKTLLIALLLLLCAFFIGYMLLEEKEYLPKQPKIILNYDSAYYAQPSRLDSLRRLFGKNKIIPKAIELETLLALSHYENLHDTYIRFILVPTFIPLSSRPNIYTILNNKKNWEYVIVISTKSMEEMEYILLKNLPFNSKVGIIGHELAHTVYYLDKGFFPIIAVALLYPFSNSFRANFEKNTDRRAVEYGLGFLLYEYAAYVRKNPAAKNSSFLDTYYLSPAEIKKIVERHQMYQKELNKYRF
ncbi:MAG: hypothetical protein EAZ55_11820 [Cytophagales bacterium]|nr:MAG: hypothetical protein EAZ55_11820 [Cytophagales bacterium]